jgi:hypothetical protein
VERSARGEEHIVGRLEDNIMSVGELSAGEHKRSDTVPDMSTPCIDTGRGSILHRLFRVRLPENSNILGACVFAYVMLLLFHFILPTVVASITMGDLTSLRNNAAGEEIRVPYLRDYNVVFASLVTIPFLVVLLLTERPFMYASVKELRDAKILRFKQGKKGEARDKEHKFYAKWSNIYLYVNLASIGLGLVGAGIASWSNYTAQHVPHFYGWQFREGSTISSWIFLLWQMPLIWLVLIFYAIRACAHLWFLKALVKESDVDINFFHRDRCGGLRDIGRLGLRNQYSLSIVGINILLMIMVLTRTNPALGHMVDGRLFGPEALEMVIISVAFYLVGAPIAFLGPLIPFHGSMQREKRKCLAEISAARKREYDQIIKNCFSSESAERDIQRMDRIERLQSLAERFPVWPFDMSTLRKFSLSYFAPVLTAIAIKLADELVQWLMTTHNALG